MEVFESGMQESLVRHIGQTVTIFTTSGGLSGNGFTGVLISIDCNVVRLLCSIGAPPACPVNSFRGRCETNNFCGNPLGSIAVIPTRAIASFTHNAI